MILHKNRLIFGVIRRIIKTVFSVVYKVIKAFNLHLTLFVLLLGLVLAIVGVINKGETSLTIFLVVLALSVLYAFMKTFKVVFGVKKKDSRVKIVKIRDEQIEQQPQQKPQQQYQQPVVQQNYNSQPEYRQSTAPKYYTVKNNPNYVYAEYDDRYELFLKTSAGLKKIRVDYKR